MLNSCQNIFPRKGYENIKVINVIYDAYFIKKNALNDQLQFHYKPKTLKNFIKNTIN